jgi:acyl carrier protein
MAEDYQALVIDVVRPFMDDEIALTEASPLEGEIDSMAMVQIILALESRLGRSFGPTDIQFDHFESVGSLARQLSLRASRSK